jgi:hypothetical protein
MRPHAGRTWGTAAVALIACAATPALAGCGSEEEEPPGSTPGAIEPIGEIGGVTVSLDAKGAFENILALTVDASGEDRTLIAGQVELGRTGPGGAAAADAEIRIAIDGEEERAAEARSVAGEGGGEALVIACGCELDPGEHEVELQGRAVRGSVPVSARSLVALDGVEYSQDPEGAGTGGPLPPAINGTVLETDSVLVTGVPSSLAELRTAGASSGEQLLIIAQVGSTRPAIDPTGVGLQAGVDGQEAERVATVPAASTKIDAFQLDAAASPGAGVELLGRLIGGGSTELDLRSMITCPCGLAAAP